MRSGHLQAFLFLLNRPEPIRQTSLLMVLAAGIGDTTTLMSGLKSLAIETQPPFSNRVTQLRVLLEQGQTLSEALAACSGLLPDQTVIAIRVGEDTGTLRQVLAEEAHRLASENSCSNPVQTSLPSVIVWAAMIMTVMVGILSFIMMFIIPKFKKIFDDFGTDLPQMTRSLIFSSDWLLQYWYLTAMPLFTLLAVPLIWIQKNYLDYLSIGRLKYSEHFPRYWTPLILRLLSLSVVAKEPLSAGIHSILTELRPGRAGTRLSRVRQNIMAGDDCWLALLRNGFLKKRELSFIQATDRTGHLDWGLIHLARTIERRRGRWADRLTTVIQPLLILFLGGVVGFVVIALFLPLIKLINDLSVVLLPV